MSEPVEIRARFELFAGVELGLTTLVLVLALASMATGNTTIAAIVAVLAATTAVALVWRVRSARFTVTSTTVEYHWGPLHKVVDRSTIDRVALQRSWIALKHGTHNALFLNAAGFGIAAIDELAAALHVPAHVPGYRGG